MNRLPNAEMYRIILPHEIQNVQQLSVVRYCIACTMEL